MSELSESRETTPTSSFDNAVVTWADLLACFTTPGGTGAVPSGVMSASPDDLVSCWRAARFQPDCPLSCEMQLGEHKPSVVLSDVTVAFSITKGLVPPPLPPAQTWQARIADSEAANARVLVTRQEDGQYAASLSSTLALDTRTIGGETFALYGTLSIRGTATS
ncbi:hypothetical protein Q5752_004135 [Cryptotrichosporon argae]